jgi:hypothetical protein
MVWENPLERRDLVRLKDYQGHPTKTIQCIVPLGSAMSHPRGTAWWTRGVRFNTSGSKSSNMKEHSLQQIQYELIVKE